MTVIWMNRTKQQKKTEREPVYHHQPRKETKNEAQEGRAVCHSEYLVFARSSHGFIMNWWSTALRTLGISPSPVNKQFSDSLKGSWT